MPQAKKCKRCGKQLWLRKIGQDPMGDDVLGWVAKRGSKPSPLYCHKDGGRIVYHVPVMAYEYELMQEL